MKRKRLRSARQRGQAMLEYALITGSVVIAFAVVSATGYSQMWTNRLEQPVNTYFIRLPDECLDGLHQCATYLQNLNTQVQIY